MYNTELQLNQAIFPLNSCQFFRKNILFVITLTWPKTVFTKKTLIFSKTVD